MGDKENCEKKVIYLSKKIAKEKAKRLLNLGYKLKPYRCKTCGKYHLTSKKDIHHKIWSRIYKRA